MTFEYSGPGREPAPVADAEPDEEAEEYIPGGNDIE